MPMAFANKIKPQEEKKMAKVKLDFTGVESYGRLSEGQHVAKIASAEIKQSQGGNDMIVVAFEAIKGSDKGSRAYENYPLAENALWKLKGMLQAIGMKCDGKVQLDLDKLIGKVCIIETADEEYNGSIRARIQQCKKLEAVAESEDEEDEDDEDEDEDEAPKKKAPAKKAVKEEAKTAKKKPMNPPDEDEDDEDEDEDWDDEEEEEEPAPKKKAAKKEPEKKAPAKAKKPVKKSEPEDDDDDDDWDEE